MLKIAHTPHRWFPKQNWPPTLLHILDDHSRVIVGARLYPRETLLAHMDFLSQVFQAVGLPLCLYVDYHSFFFTHTPEAHTQLAAALHFYGVSLRFAPTPQAKGKIERAHRSGKTVCLLYSRPKTSGSFPRPIPCWR